MHLINKNIAKVYKLEENGNYEIETVEPLSLLSAKRLDIVAKFVFLKYRTLSFASEIYFQQVRAVTKFSIIEIGNDRKKSFDDYKNTFLEIDKNIRENGYKNDETPIPVNIKGIPLDGAHRIASAIFNKKYVNIIRLPINDSDCFDYSFLREYGMDDNYLDFIVQEYTNLCECFICNIWPIASHYKDKIISDLKVYGTIVYEKKIFLSYNGLFNYMHQIYRNDDWVGSIENKFNGVYRKVEPCYKKDSPFVLVIFQKKEEINIINLKKTLRSHFDLDKHSLHINDTQDEAKFISKILLNENSIFFLNNADPFKYKKWYTLLFKNKYEDKQIEITGSSVLALFGIRDANDIDYIGMDNENGDNHNKFLSYYDSNIEELLNNPKNYFYYNNIKFLTLNNILNFKNKRDEAKDRDDVYLIKNFLSIYKDNSKKNLKRTFLLCKRKGIAKIQGAIIKFAHFSHTYYLLRNIYRKLTRKRK